MNKLSILIPTIKKHDHFFTRLKFELYAQMLNFQDQIELLSDDHEYDSIGEKRNRLLDRATGEYTAFIDSDDRVSLNYVSILMEGIEKGVDCCSLLGVITTNKNDPQYFEHSIRYKEYKTNDTANFDLVEVKYERFPNHISCIKSEVSKSFRFPEKNWGEDTDWATQINNSGLLKTEHYIDEILYYYDYISDKNA